MMHKSIETGQKKTSAQSARSDEPMHLGDRSSSFRERRPDAASVVLAVGTAQAREEQEAPQQQAPPDMRTGQSAKACLRREVPTDHEAHGQAQRRQLRRVATELRRDRDPEAEAKHAKHGRIRTQISYLSRMTSDRGGEETVTSTHSGWRGAGGAGQSSRPPSTTMCQSSRALEDACGREHVGQHVDRQGLA